MTPRRRISLSAAIWLLLGLAYFVIPLLATFLVSLRSDQTAKCCTFANYSYILDDPEFWRTIKLSFIVALETIALTLVLLVPTVYWVHLKVPRLRPLIGFLALVPFVVAPIILVVGQAAPRLCEASVNVWTSMARNPVSSEKYMYGNARITYAATRNPYGSP